MRTRGIKTVITGLTVALVLTAALVDQRLDSLEQDRVNPHHVEELQDLVTILTDGLTAQRATIDQLVELCVRDATCQVTDQTDGGT